MILHKCVRKLRYTFRSHILIIRWNGYPAWSKNEQVQDWRVESNHLRNVLRTIPRWKVTWREK